MNARVTTADEVDGTRQGQNSSLSKKTWVKTIRTYLLTTGGMGTTQ